MKKKVLSVLLTVAMAATLLAGCGNGKADQAEAPAETQQEAPEAEAPEAEAPEAEAPEAEAPEAEAPAEGEVDMSKAQGKKVGMTVPTLQSDFINYLTQALQAAVAELGAELQVDSCDGDVTRQIEQMENYVTMGMDCIVAFPINGEALGVAAKNAVDQGVPVFAFAMEVPNVTTAMISAEEAVMGAACGEMASNWINENYADAADGSVKVYVVRGTTSPEITERSNAIVEELKKNSKIQLVEEECENENSQDVARRLVENQFNANPDINVIVCCNGESSLGANSFIMSADSPVKDLSKFAIFAVDETQEIDQKIKESIENKSALRGTISMGSIADTVHDFMIGMVPILTEQEPIPRIDGSIFPIDATNVEDYLAE